MDKKKTIKFEETPRGLWRKRRWRMRKKKKGFSLEKGDNITFFFQAVSVEPTTLFCCLVFWAPRLRLGM